MLEQIEKLQTYGLDTLSEYALRRRVERWTGTLHHPDSLAAQHPVGQEAADVSTFEQIVEQWRRAREPYADGQVDDVLGEFTSLAYDVRLLDAPTTDTLTSVAVGGDAAVATADVAADVAVVHSADVVSLADSVDVVAELAAEHSMLPADIADALVVASQAGYATHSSPLSSEFLETLTSVGFNILVVVIFAAYLFCIYRYFDDVVALLYSVFRRNIILSERVVERRRSEIFYGFLGKLFLLGVAFIGLLSLAWVYMGRGVDIGVSQQMALYALPVSVGLFIAVVVFQSLLLSIVGVVTASFTTVSALIRIRLIYFVLYTLIAAPMLLVALLGHSGGHQVWMNIGLVAAVVTLLLYARESVELFISKKVSILHWILYLCTVEILPLTLIWQIAIRLR